MCPSLTKAINDREGLVAIKDNGLGESWGVCSLKRGPKWVFPSLRFLGADLWSPVLGRRALVSLVELFVAEGTVQQYQELGCACEETIHAPKGLGGISSPRPAGLVVSGGLIRVGLY